jgi:hypothetical protein
MLFGTRYKFIGDRSPDAVKALLAAFGEHGAAPGTIAHYVMADGRGGLVIGESDSITEAYENMLNYSEWLEFETHPLLTIEDALPSLMKKYG